MASLSRSAADVRITEVDLSTTIQQNSAITAALVAVSSQGPVGPTYYTSFAAFRADFGDPKASVSFDHYAAADFFAEGNALWVYRAVGSGAAYGALLMYVNASGATRLTPVSITDTSVIDWLTITPAGGSPLYVFYPKRGPGSYSASLSLSVAAVNLNAPSGVTVTGASSGGALFAGTYAYQVSAIDKNGGESVASAQVTLSVASGVQNKNTISWEAQEGAVGYRVYGRQGSALYLLGTVGTSGSLTFVDTGAVVPDSAYVPISNVNNAVSSPQFTLSVFSTQYALNSPVEKFDVSLTDVTDDLGVQLETASRVNAFSEYIGCQSYVPALLTLPRVTTAARTYFATGASGTAPTSADVNAGWSVFLDREKYVIDALVNAGRATPSVQLHMDYVASTRNDCVALLDTPSTLQKATAAVDYRRLSLNLNSSFSALFCPDLLESDAINGKTLHVPPSGAMAALMARTTRVAQPWFSMAGLNRGLLRVLDVRYTYNDGEATALYQSQVNYMRRMLGSGIPLWEQSTLYSKASALQFLNVRILANVIKRSVYSFLLYSLQEPNDDILRKQIQYGLEAYLSYVQGARGIRSFSVTCNDSNNGAAVVNSGQLNVAVYIVPTLGTRAINLSLLIGKQGLQVSETDVAALSA